MKNKFLKVFFISLAIIITLFTFSVSSFATFDVYFNDDLINFPDLPVDPSYSNFIIRCQNISPPVYELFLFNGDAYIGGDDYDDLFFLDSSNYAIYRCVYTNSWEFYSKRDTGVILSFNTLYSPIVYSSVDIYSDSDKSDVFFQATPVQQGVVVLEGVEQLPQAIIQVLKIVIPIGLIILASFLVISLIKSVIFRLR